MAVKEIAGATVDFDDDGFMTDHTKWNREIAAEIAKEEGIDALTDRHWTVIEYMRKVFEETGDGPTIRSLKNKGGVPTKELYELFPKGPAKKAARIAGIKKPSGCI